MSSSVASTDDLEIDNRTNLPKYSSAFLQFKSVLYLLELDANQQEYGSLAHDFATTSPQRRARMQTHIAADPESGRMLYTTKRTPTDAAAGVTSPRRRLDGPHVSPSASSRLSPTKVHPTKRTQQSQNVVKRIVRRIVQKSPSNANQSRQTSKEKND